MDAGEEERPSGAAAYDSGSRRLLRQIRWLQLASLSRRKLKRP
jgi:hypothetical protein